MKKKIEERSAINSRWGFYSLVAITIYAVLQLMRWRIFPQFMDIYYHFLTAWGFIQAGGYSGWDFWQYAPVGRVHMYPPLFHLFLAVLMKMGVSIIFLAKFFEAVSPVLFLLALWSFIKNNYNERLAFFVIIAFSSSFSFYLSLINHVPATIGLIFGIFALGRLLKGKLMSCAFFLALCFYTHIGVSWLFIFTVVVYGIINRGLFKASLKIALVAIVLAAPVLIKQVTSLQFIKAVGFNLSETYICQIKIFDYILAVLGIFAVRAMDRRYRLFIALALASLIFALYPYRLFSAEGYLPVILLSAVFLYYLYNRSLEKAGKRYMRRLLICIIGFILLVSPTVAMDKPNGQAKVEYSLKLFDSAFLGMLFARGESIWFPEQYEEVVNLIKHSSDTDDIIYCTINITGITLASLSGRATANALLPEIGPSARFDPYEVSRIIIFAKDDPETYVEQIVSKYGLRKIGENKMFIVYERGSGFSKAIFRKASVCLRPFL